MFKPLLLLGLGVLLGSCVSDSNEDLLALALQSNAPKIQKVLEKGQDHELQILLSTIDFKDKKVIFRDYAYQVNDSNYFYPASTVKFPAAVLALEQLNKRPSYHLDTSYVIEGDSVATTFRNDIEDIFAVSSNVAFNNLYEFMGPAHINERLTQLGVGPVRYSHRLSTPNADTLWQRSIAFTNSGSNGFITNGGPIVAATPLQINRTQKGIGYYKNDSLISEPMDFSKKNYLPLTSLHNVMKRAIFPDAFNANQRFNLSVDQQLFLLETMQKVPKELGYQQEEYYDSYVKFFMFGDTKKDIPKHIKIGNKVGYAYGYLTDTAYIIDTQNQVAFILSATIHVNENGIFNDNVYEYQTIGIPFLAEVGRQVHQVLIDKK